MSIEVARSVARACERRRATLDRKISSEIAALVLAVAVGFVLAASPASATSAYLCEGYSACGHTPYSAWGYSGTAYSSRWWNMDPGRNCTNYVAFRFVNRKYDKLSNTRPWSGSGNAYYWGVANSSKVNDTPAVGSVAWWNSSYYGGAGHVAYVEKVISSTDIWISESNFNGNDIAWRHLTKGSVWPWPRFIHFKDEDLNAATAPTVTGTPKVGSRLTASPGSWKSSSGVTPTAAMTYKYQWYASGAAISGATASTYTPTEGMVGKPISVKVTASALGYTAMAATSAQTGAVAAGTFTNTVAPTVSGTPKVGSTVSASSGGWSPTPSTITYQWSANGTAVIGATASSYTIDPDLVGQTLTVTVTVARPGYTTATKTSTPTAPVSPGDLQNSAPPAITGSAVVGQTLTAATGTWSPTPDSITWQWSANGVPIAGATADSFVIGPSQLGSQITVTQTATRFGYTDASATSSATSAVAPGEFNQADPPKLRGHARAGSKLAVTPGRWEPTPTATKYRWSVGAKRIWGVHGPVLKLKESMIGHRVKVQVTIAAPGYRKHTISLHTEGRVRG